jgi:lantibiotic modifying enzyme
MAHKLTATAQGHPKADYLASARAVARWIVSRQRGRYWPNRSDEPLAEPVDLYYGTAGTILFFRELAESTGEQSYRDIALTDAAHIADQIEKVTASGLYRGLAGIVFALDQMVQANGDTSLLSALNLGIDRLQANAKQGDPGVWWNESNDLISGTAGIGLALIYLGMQTGRDDLLKSAKAAGDGLLALAHEAPEGNYWTISTTCSTHYPNFSHGTAGVGYFLTELYEVTQEECYLASGLAAGHYLRSVASRAEFSDCLVFHDDTAGRDLFYLGWCHGPAGTGRFFYRLYQLTKDPDWLELVERQAATLLASGIPERQTPGYWNNVSRCCGAAGVGDFFLGLYRAIKDPGYLAFAERLADYLIARADTDASGMRWTQAERRIEPDNVDTQTGLMQGAAGIGLFLVHLDQVYRNYKPLIRFPDEPSWEEAGLEE